MPEASTLLLQFFLGFVTDLLETSVG